MIIRRCVVVVAGLALVLALGAGALGCGAKTAPLIDDGGPRDAGMLPVDASEDAGLPFFTFPCRWGLGRETVLVRHATPLRDVLAAVSVGSDVALAMTADVTGTTGYRGAIVSIEDPPTILRPVSHDQGGEVLGLADGWAQLAIGDAGCRLVRYDMNFAAMVGADLLATTSACALERRDARLLEIASDDGVQTTLTALALSSDVAIPPTAAVMRATATGASFDPRFGWLALSIRGGGGLEPGRLPSAGARDVARLAEGARTFEVEPDRLRPGILVLREDAAGREWLERVSPVGDPPVPETLLEVSGLGTSTGHLVSTEAEAGIALRDGRVIFSPTSGTPPTVLMPVSASAPEDIHIALRAGTSVGVVAYDYFDAASSEHRLAVRALTCNR